MKNIILINIKITSACFLIILLFAGQNFAQSKTGTTIGQFLKIEPSARVAALGNAGASLSGEISIIVLQSRKPGKVTGN